MKIRSVLASVVVALMLGARDGYSQPYPLNGIHWEFWQGAPNGINFYLSDVYYAESETYRTFYIWAQFTNPKPGYPRSFVIRGGVGCITKRVIGVGSTAYDQNNRVIESYVPFATEFPFDSRIASKYCRGL